MKAVLTRVTNASVTVDGAVVGAIDCPETGGVLALVGVGRDDAEDAWRTVARKIAELRIMADETSVSDSGGGVLVISQFTLHADVRKGRRPSWNAAAPGAVAEPVVDAVADGLRERGIEVATGRFGADMAVDIHGDGPVTLVVDVPA